LLKEEEIVGKIEVIIVQRVRTEAQVGIISTITVVDKETGEIIRQDATARQLGNIIEVGRRSLQSAIDDCSERGEFQTLETDDIFTVGTYCKLRKVVEHERASLCNFRNL
jgi:hypothetical protein